MLRSGQSYADRELNILHTSRHAQLRLSNSSWPYQRGVPTNFLSGRGDFRVAMPPGKAHPTHKTVAGIGIGTVYQ